MTNETPPRQTLSALTGELTETLQIPGEDPALLARQAELLDALFTTILDKKISTNIDAPYRGDAARDWLHFALRVQKQCTDTVKARAAIEYMSHLSAPKPLSHPLKMPPKNKS